MLFHTLAVVCALSLGAGEADSSAVRLWEAPLVLPTYLVDSAEQNPIFYQGRKYQGAKGPVYPYPMLDRLTDVRQDKTYTAVYLENRYVKYSILPELGGRIFTGTDKTNQYEFFYRQHVIKPALIGMAGAWISGGVEWNVPHHHRVATYMPVDYRLVSNPDGSKTLWLGELERRHRMRWLVGLTLRPDKSYLEITTKIFNRTPLAHSMLLFANVAVHAGPDYQVIFPPRTRVGCQHAKREFVNWPIGQGVYADVDFTGVDVSWWKNHPKPVSIFAMDCEEDFFGGYDHGRRAGVVHVADHHIAPGKKFFEWGNGPEGRMWDKVLTETDGPYLELMAGAFSDNQPDYSWIEPSEVRVVKEYWYPVRETGGFRAANLQAAANIELGKKGRARVSVNTTSAVAGAVATLRAGGRTLLERKIAAAPDRPWSAEVALPAGVAAEALKLSVCDAKGREMVACDAPRDEKPAVLPEPVDPPAPPAEVKSLEELYLIGLRLEQFHNPALEPDPYYEEALRRDPADVRSNTALGILYCKRGRFAEAQKHLETALRRLTHNYTRPKDGEAHYYLGVALRAQGKPGAAEDALQRAIWSYAWSAPAHQQIAELACRRGQWAKALDHVDRSLAAGAANTKALALRAAILRKLGQPNRALPVAERAAAIDPIDFLPANEIRLAKAALGENPEADAMQRDMHACFEAAVDYGNCGLYPEAIEVLSQIVDRAADKSAVYPMVYYYLGYYHQQCGNATEGRTQYRLGRQAPPDYCFPFRLESVDVLRQAMAADAQDARAPYYLGNLLYDIQPLDALAAWEESARRDGEFAMVHRNLGVGYAQAARDPAKAVTHFERALACNPRDPKIYAELDQVYRVVGRDPQERLALLEKNHEVVRQRMDSLLREILLGVLLGRYDRAIELLKESHFRRWEGEIGAHDSWVDAHLLRGQQRLAAGKKAEALADFLAADEYPLNLEVGRPYVGAERDAKVYYFTGLAYESLGQRDKARESFAKATRTKTDWAEAWYYQGLGFRKLGDEGRARERFDSLLRSGRDGLRLPEPVDFFAKFGVRRSEAARHAEFHHQIGLGLLGQGRAAEAKKEFAEAVRLDVDHLGARSQLAGLGKKG